MAKKIPTWDVSAAEVARHFVYHFVFNSFDYALQVVLLADKTNAFPLKFFQDVGHPVNIHDIYTIAYHLQANGRVGGYKCIILAKLFEYVADHWRDWEQYTDSLMYPYNCQQRT